MWDRLSYLDLPLGSTTGDRTLSLDIWALDTFTPAATLKQKALFDTAVFSYLLLSKTNENLFRKIETTCAMSSILYNRKHSSQPRKMVFHVLNVCKMPITVGVVVD